MEYTIERVGQMALGIVSDGREHVERKHVEVSLLGAQSVPAEFKEGDRIRIVNPPTDFIRRVLRRTIAATTP